MAVDRNGNTINVGDLYALSADVAGITGDRITLNTAREPITLDAGDLVTVTDLTDHGTLSGLLDDDHTQYVLADGTRNITGPFTIEGNTTIGTAGGGDRTLTVNNSLSTKSLKLNSTGTTSYVLADASSGESHLHLRAISDVHLYADNDFVTPGLRLREKYAGFGGFTGDAEASVDIIGANLKQLRIGSNETPSSTQTSYITMRSYADTFDVSCFYVQAGSTYNDLSIGGGTFGAYSATKINMYIGATATTLSGDKVVEIDDSTCTISDALEVISGSSANHLLLTDSDDDDTNKVAIIRTRHYDSGSQNDVTMVYADVTNTYHRLFLGGGTASFNAATEMRFALGSSTTSGAGTERARLTTTGLLIKPTGVSSNATVPLELRHSTGVVAKLVCADESSTASLQLENDSTNVVIELNASGSTLLKPAGTTKWTLASSGNVTQTGDLDMASNDINNAVLVTPTIASFTNATHDHEDAAGGGVLGPDGLLRGENLLFNNHFIQEDHAYSSADTGTTGAGVSIIQGSPLDKDHPGIVEINAGSDDEGGAARIYTTYSVLMGAAGYACRMRVRTPSGTTGVVYRLGIGDQTSYFSAPPNGIFVWVNRGVSDKWKFTVDNDTSGASTTTSTITATADTWFDILLTFDGTTARAYIDGAEIGSGKTSPLPTATGQAVGLFASVFNNSEASNALHIDRWLLSADGLTAWS